MKNFELFGIHMPSASILIASVMLVTQGDPHNEDLYIFLLIVFGVIATIQLMTVAIKRIKGSTLSEIAKSLWVFIVLFFPITGSICALAMIDKN